MSHAVPHLSQWSKQVIGALTWPLVSLLFQWSSEGNPGGSQGSCNSLKTPPSPWRIHLNTTHSFGGKMVGERDISAKGHWKNKQTLDFFTWGKGACLFYCMSKWPCVGFCLKKKNKNKFLTRLQFCLNSIWEVSIFWHVFRICITHCNNFLMVLSAVHGLYFV